MPRGPELWPKYLMGGSTDGLSIQVSAYDMRLPYECLECANPTEDRGGTIEAAAHQLRRLSRAESSDCALASLTAVAATAEDVVTLAGVGLAVKGLRGGRLALGIADNLTAEMVGIPEEFTGRATAQASFKKSRELSLFAFMSGAQGEAPTLKSFVLDLIPIVHAVRAINHARHVCF